MAGTKNRSAIVGYERLHRVGVELEGMWMGDHPVGPAGAPVGGSIIRDGSVCDHFGERPPIYSTSTGETVELKNIRRPFTLGEVTSNPPVEPLTSIDLMETFVRKHYPDFIDSTCGLHIHMSTVMRYVYNRLLTPEYTGDNKSGEEGVIFKALGEWAKEKAFPKEHPIWDRLAGKNRYCLRSFRADGQAKARDKGWNHGAEDARYTAIAFHWARRGSDGQPMRTVECRLLPMLETPALAVEALKVVVKATNDFLNKEVVRREPTFTFTVPLSRGRMITRRVTRLGRRRTI